jgi:protocatechuate 3,4-dioxygenase beta subunit
MSKNLNLKTPNILTLETIGNVPDSCPKYFITEETEGPYYKSGSPEKTNFIEPGIPGEPIILTGYVFDKNCKPIAGAWIDFWQANGNGNYDNKGYKLRGHQFTDARGRYILQTVIPGVYMDRTNHIHVKLSRSKPGNISNTAGGIVTTQLYFPDTAENKSDPLYDRSSQVNIEERDGKKIAFFNFKINQ